MPRISQEIQDIKHLVLLRKALAGKHSLEIYCRDPSMRLTIGEGLFHGGDCVDTVCTMIEKPLPIFDWEELERKATFIAQNPKEVFSQAIAKMKPERDRLITYLRTFSKLPRVRMRPSSIFHFDQAMQAEYQALYRLSLTGGGARVADYLIASAGINQLRYRTGVVIASYCLGDFVSAERIDKKSGKRGVVSRIMAHFRKS